MPSCVVKNCTNYSTARPDGISFHRFPKQQISEWKKAIGQPMLQVEARHVVCSLHFLETDFLKAYGNRRRLKADAVPSQLIPSAAFKRKLCFSESSTEDTVKSSYNNDESLLHLCSSDLDMTNKVSRSSSSSTCSSASLSNHKKRIKWMHAYGRSPSKQKQDLRVKQAQLYKYKFRLHAARQRITRLKKTITNLKQIVHVLKRSDLISTNAAKMLENTFSGIPLIVMKRILTNLKAGKNTRRKFPTELKNFAMTLQFYSPKAYDFVRRSFNLCLPAPSVIRSWLAKVDCEPGYSKPSLDILRTLVQSKKEGEVLLTALIFDEMAIKKQVDLEGSNLITRGYVDTGTGTSDETTLALEALVFMLVCVNGYWKLPLGYFLINKLTGEEKAELVLETLKLLHELGVTVISVTCDGPCVNFAMAKTLGCNLIMEDEIKPWFIHPSTGERVHLFLDICHMLKLIRNNWAKIRQFLNGQGEVIDWQFIELLYQLQEDENFKLANKLSRIHLDWKKSIMKVNLAAQTMSNSVANALEFLKDELKLPEFQNAGPTIEFIRIINNLFDILNSRNPFARGFKTPLRRENEEYWRPFLNDAITYLWNCKNLEGVPLYRTPNKTPIIGFIVSSISALAIYEQYVKASPLLKYVLTYKFSQDHLELFFCSVRSRNGWNNNPTCSQFIKTYKRLLVHSDIKHFSGNCTAQDGTEVFTLLSKKIDVQTKGVLGISTVGQHRVENQSATCIVDEDEELTDILPISLSALAENVVAYIAGFVVRKVLQRLKCEKCVFRRLVSKMTHINVAAYFRKLTIA